MTNEDFRLTQSSIGCAENKFYEFIFMESTVSREKAYVITFTDCKHKDAKEFSIFPRVDHESNMTFPYVSVNTPDGGYMLCPYIIEEEKLVIDEIMWESYNRKIPTKKEYEILNGTVKALIRFLEEDYKLETKGKWVSINHKTMEDLAIIGKPKEY